MRPISSPVVRHSAWLLRLGSVLLVAVAAGCGASGTEAAEKLTRSIKAEVPPIATQQQAEAWLKARGFEPSYFVDTTGDRVGGQTMATRAGLRDEDLGGMVRGQITCPSKQLGVGQYGRLSIYFFFDKRGSCVGHWVDWFEYCL